MKLEGKRIGFAMTGSFCSFKKAIEQMKNVIIEKADIIPIMSYNAYNLDTKYGRSKDFIAEIEKITRKRNITYITRHRTNWTKKNDRFSNNRTSNRKYNIQISKRHNRYSCDDGSKVAFKK